MIGCKSADMMSACFQRILKLIVFFQVIYPFVSQYVTSHLYTVYVPTPLVTIALHPTSVSVVNYPGACNASYGRQYLIFPVLAVY